MRRAKLAMLIVALAGNPAFAGGISIPGTYSSLRFHPESGDLLGVELRIVPSAAGFSVIAQGSEGAPADPIVVPVVVDGDSIQFDIPTRSNCGLAPGRYDGEIAPSGIKLKGPASEALIILERGVSYWDRQDRRITNE